MKTSTTRLRTFVLPFLLCGVAACTAPAQAPVQEQAVAQAPISLIPLPASLQRAEGHFTVAADARVHIAGDDARAAAEEFARLAGITQGVTLAVEAGTGGIEFRIDPAATGTAAESYSLQSGPDGVVVSAREPRGLFYGAISLWQLLSKDAAGAVIVPALRIEDAPRFGWRGMMLDSARHMQSVEEIKQVLDTMSLHKLNTFHWHLTDDQGWRVEIKRYPRLTEIGSCRIPLTVPGSTPPPEYCGFYTQDQIRDVVAYAAARHITVVPEFDMPGHAQAAVAAYPELGVTGTTPTVSAEWGVHKFLFNVDEPTFEFLENVMAEMIPLFPGTYFHVGGDEAVKDQWQASASVQEHMRKLGIATEADLQSWFIHRLEEYLSGHGKRLIGWDEILEGGLPAEATVMSWRGIEGGIEAAGEGHDVVMAPSTDLYLDYLQTTSANEFPGRPATIPMSQVYAFEPVPKALTADKHHHIIGVQANIWTEHMRDFNRVQHAMLPRLAALAEIAWTPAALKDWPGFLARLPAQLPRYQALGIGYARTPFEVVSEAVASGDGKVTVKLANALGYDGIRYTLDGSEPTATSTVYAGPVEATLPASVRAAVFVDGVALATPDAWQIDAASLLTRSDEELQMCTGALMLRLEDDGPVEGERAIFNADIFNPCWLWKAAPMDGIAGITVRAGRIPYNFQLAGDEKHRRFTPAESEHGELRVSAGCDGPVLATVPLPTDAEADGFLTLPLTIEPGTAAQDLCVVFTGDTRPAYWVLDRITLQPN